MSWVNPVFPIDAKNSIVFLCHFFFGLAWTWPRYREHSSRDTRRHTGVKTIFHSSRLLHLTQDPCKEGMWNHFFHVLHIQFSLLKAVVVWWGVVRWDHRGVCNSKSLCRHLLCDVIEMEDLTPAGETSSLYPMELSLLQINHILRQHILYFWTFMTHYTCPKNSRKNIQVIRIEIEPSLSQSMTT